MSGFTDITTIIITGTDGELLQKQEKKIYRKREKTLAPSFALLMSSCHSIILRLPSGELRLLIALSFHLDYEGNVDLSQFIRKKICTDLSIHKKTLSNLLLSLKNKGIIQNRDASKIAVSPEFFFRGELSNFLDRTSDYSESARNISYQNNSERS